MKYVHLAQFGDESGLSIKEGEPPKINTGQVRIRVRAAGVNRADLAQRQGFYPPPKGESEVLGLEVSGEVQELGEGTGQVRVGERVMALLAGGGYAEEVVVDEGLLIPLPSPLSFEQGAATAEVFLTAHHNLFHLAQLQKGQRALVHAGASGVGTAAIQLCREAGIEIFTTVGSDEKKTACEKIGARAFNYKSGDWGDWLLKQTREEGVHAILDPVGASYFARNLMALTTGGVLIQIASLSGTKTELSLSELMRKRLTVRGSTLRGLPLSEKREVVRRFRAQFGKSLEAGRIAPLMDTVFPFSQVQAAHRRMAENKNIGKMVLKWE